MTENTPSGPVGSGEGDLDPQQELNEDVAPNPPGTVIGPQGPGRKTHPDDTRKWLAGALVFLLVLVVCSACYGWLWGDKTTDDLQGFALVLSPIVTLVGTVLGFYFSGALGRGTK